MNATLLMKEATATHVQLFKLIANALEHLSMPQSLPLLVAGVYVIVFLGRASAMS